MMTVNKHKSIYTQLLNLMKIKVTTEIEKYTHPFQWVVVGASLHEKNQATNKTTQFYGQPCNIENYIKAHKHTKKRRKNNQIPTGRAASNNPILTQLSKTKSSNKTRLHPNHHPPPKQRIIVIIIIVIGIANHTTDTTSLLTTASAVAATTSSFVFCSTSLSPPPNSTVNVDFMYNNE